MKNRYLEGAVFNVSDVDLANVFAHNKDTREVLGGVRGKQLSTVKLKQLGDHLFTNEYESLVSSDTARHVASS